MWENIVEYYEPARSPRQFTIPLCEYVKPSSTALTNFG